MNGNAARWVLAALMVILLAFLISSPAMAEVTPLPLDHTVPGRPLKDGGFLSGMAYEDESIHAAASETEYLGVKCHLIDVTIADPTQIRTAASGNSVKGNTYVKGEAMAKAFNAVAAVNGDFFKYHYKDSYVIRQGEFYYDIENDPGKGFNKPEGYLRDVLLIDNAGDFWAVKKATNEKIEAFLREGLPEGRTVVNTFTFGPVLVEDGEAQPYTTVEFQPKDKMQRAAIVQVDTLTYAIVECDGKTDGSYGLTMAEFADFIAERYPTCRMAFNLDGGGSTHVMFNGFRIHDTYGVRNISDILYFASAAGEE